MASEGQKLPFELLGEQFVQQYYAVFDSLNKESLLTLYHPEAFVTFEGTKASGHAEIKVLLDTKLQFQKIVHSITKVDCHPTAEQGVIVLVFGRLKTDDDPPHDYCQTFYVRPANNSYFIFNDIFRLALHDM